MTPFRTQIPLGELACDVLVAGGGAAGLAAAVAAARAGARTLLLERGACLGGTATAGLVGTVCGLYLRDSQGERPTLVAGGFPEEFAARLARASASAPIRLGDGLWVLSYEPWAFARVAGEFVRETPNLELALHATLTGARAEENKLTRVGALAWNEAVIIRPGSVVDCTGEATAAALAGAPTEEGMADQVPAMVFVMENVDPAFGERGMLDTLRAVRRAVERGELPAGCEHMTLAPGSGAGGRGGRVAFKLNLACRDDLQSQISNLKFEINESIPQSAFRIPQSEIPAWRQVTAWEEMGRALVDRIQAFLIFNVRAFKEARLSAAPAQLGVRSGRRLLGRSILSEHDILACAKPADGVARGCWPIEAWHGGPRPTMTFFPENDYYEIPLDCLRAPGLDNVFTAGRSISATPLALASARVIGTALATGWAAGTAAAFFAAGRPMTDAVTQIRITQTRVSTF